MFKLLMATCLAMMTPHGPQLANCQIMVEQPERWYQDKEECMQRAQTLRELHEEQFKDTPVVGRVSCLSKEQLEEIEARHGEKIRA